jgi:hypothetical protein
MSYVKPAKYLILTILPETCWFRRHPALQPLDAWPNNRLAHIERTGRALRARENSGREESPPRESTPCLDAASQSDDLGGQHVQQSRTHLCGASDDGVGPPRGIPQSKRMRKTVYRNPFPDRHRNAHSDDDGLGQKSDDYGDSRDDTDGNGTDGDDRECEEDYQPPLLEGSEGELYEEDDFGPLPSKRRKTVSAIPTTPKTNATQRLRSSGPVSQPREVQSPAHGGKRSSRRSIPSSPSSRASHDGKGAVGAVFARFEEWPLENASLKRVTENGMTIFQLQFRWDSCEHATESPRSEFPVNKRNSAKRGATARAAITPDEDDLVIKLKEVNNYGGGRSIRSSRRPFQGESGALRPCRCDTVRS